MKLKGASPAHEGAERPDAWELDDELRAIGRRFGIEADRDLVGLGLTSSGCATLASPTERRALRSLGWHLLDAADFSFSAAPSSRAPC